MLQPAQLKQLFQQKLEQLPNKNFVPTIMVGTAVPTVVVGTVVPTVIVGTGVPTRVLGTAANTFFVPTIIVGTIVPTMIVGTAVPTIIVLMAYYWKSCVGAMGNIPTRRHYVTVVYVDSGQEVF